MQLADKGTNNIDKVCIIESNIPIVHELPSQPGAHKQEKYPSSSIHVALFWHGLLEHSLISVQIHSHKMLLFRYPQIVKGKS